MNEITAIEEKEEWFNIPNELEKKIGIWIVHAGHTKANPNYHIAPRTINHYTIHMIMEGDIIFKQDNHTHHLEQGSWFCLFPGWVSEYKIKSPDQPLRMLYLAVDGQNTLSILDRLGVSPSKPHLLFHEHPHLIHNIQSIFKTLKDKPANKDLLLISAIAQLICHLSSDGDSQQKIKDWVQDGKEYMDLHFMKGISVRHVSEYLNIHRSHLTKKFVEVYQMTPKHYLLKLKMDKAAELLHNTTMTVSEIAYSLDYSDLFSFSRAYKNYFNQSPSGSRSHIL